jgi:hypothetical protein
MLRLAAQRPAMAAGGPVGQLRDLGHQPQGELPPELRRSADSANQTLPQDPQAERKREAGQQRQRQVLERERLDGRNRNAGLLEQRHAPRRPHLRPQRRHPIGKRIKDSLFPGELRPGELKFDRLVSRLPEFLDLVGVPLLERLMNEPSALQLDFQFLQLVLPLHEGPGLELLLQSRPNRSPLFVQGLGVLLDLSLHALVARIIPAAGGGMFDLVQEGSLLRDRRPQILIFGALVQRQFDHDIGHGDVSLTGWRPSRRRPPLPEA